MQSACWLPCLPLTTNRNTSSRITPTIEAVAKRLEELKQQYDGFGSTTALLPVAFCREQPRVIRDDPDIWEIRGGFSRDSQLPPHSITVFTHLKRSSFLGVGSWLSFPYCAFVFPKRKGHGTHDLLNQWCSLGITTRQRGESCILELLGNWLLLLKKPASVSYCCILLHFTWALEKLPFYR